MLLAGPRVASAEPMEVPAGSTIILPRGDRVPLDETHWLVDRGMLDRANAAAELAERLTVELVRCSKAAIELARPEPGWRIATRWALYGISVGAAFTAGALLF